jgi:hypothetical protein
MLGHFKQEKPQQQELEHSPPGRFEQQVPLVSFTWYAFTFTFAASIAFAFTSAGSFLPSVEALPLGVACF